MKRILLFAATNIAVLAVLTIVCKLLGVDVYLAQTGQDFTHLLIFAAILGFTGSLISLAMSKSIAIRSTGAQVIDPSSPRSQTEQWLVQTVHRQAEQAGIGKPDVAIYDAPEMNAFATGMNRNNALVAVSTGLLQQMGRDEVEAVLGHEVAHVANGDMVTMALLQGVLNTFVIVASRLIGRVVDQVVFKNDRGPGMGYWITVMVLQVVLGMLASIIAMWFSRQREFRADHGGATLAGRQKMINALRRLGGNAGVSTLPEEVEAFGISGRMADGLKRLFMSHPPIPERIAALEASR
ncbi:protease HtpX [Pseudofulvimonas gallinarii]|jgi:heat shock protein HtpX|uniref:Protease HtpX n=1 Tax=Pseudofulvimonas gallinarii TaxID=634155 RepID=A0A4R3L2G8_9GAMM|nr:protease HtpX [Pseudofulvimonas gallinarii]TCS93038.1 heat shock protein [Pseudofulvimonas gallinarii]THD11420.1 zinc metalloprotease HtpX [Pseudofulvimonas gallinarii]